VGLLALHLPAARAADKERLAHTIQALSTQGSRLAGYPGDSLAADFLEAALRGAGVSAVTREQFEVVVPMDEGATLELLDQGVSVPLASLWPNLVRTSSTGPDGIVGPLSYAGRGEYWELDGKPVQDAILLLEFDSWDNWLRAAALGARAIIFIEPEHTTVFEARQKWSWTPHDVPRFWVERRQGLRLRELLADGSSDARVTARMAWQRRPAWNIWGMIPGQDPALRDELWVVQTYYDGLSVVPALTPAAESAGSAAALIELAHYLRDHPPGRSVALVATGAHFLGQAGLEHFFDQHARKRVEFRRRMPQRFVADSLRVDRLLSSCAKRGLPLDSLGIRLTADPVTGEPTFAGVDMDRLVAQLKLMQLLNAPDSLGIYLEPDSLAIDLFICLDLASHSDQIGIWHNTNRPEYRRFYVPLARSFVRHAREVAAALGRPPERALVNGISPIKGYAWESYVNPDVVIPDGVVAQNAGQMAVSLMTTHDARLATDTPLDRADRVDCESLHAQVQLLERLLHAALGDTGVFGPERRELRKKHDENIKDQLLDVYGSLRLLPRRSTTPTTAIPGAVVAVQPMFPARPWRPEILMADLDGEYEARSLTPGQVGIQAFLLDPVNGSIRYATDMGERAQSFGRAVRTLSKAQTLWTTIMFPALPLEVFERVDSQFLFSLGQDAAGIQVLDKRGTKPAQYGLVLGDWKSTSLVLFGTERDSLRLLERSLVLLNNAGATDEESAQGVGYRLGKQRLIPFATLESARNLWRLNEVRNERLRRYAIENPRVEERHAYAERLIRLAETAIGERSWSRYARAAREALGIEYQAYHDVRGTQDDVIAGLVFFVALIIPAAFFAERLLFAVPDIRKQLLVFAAILLVIWLILAQVHPAFQLAHPIIILLALLIAVMALFVVALIVSRFNAFMADLQRRAAGTQSADISRSGTSYVAFMLGISNMRRRPLRTTLTLTTITLLTFSVLSFTSFRPKISYVGFKKDWEAPYHGALLHDLQWWPWEFSVLDYVQSHFGEVAVVSPRTWLSRGQRQEGEIPILRGGQQVDALTLLGLTPQEPLVTGIDRALVAGSWFADENERSLLLPLPMAARLDIGPADVGRATVRVFGREWTVRGLFDPDTLAAVRDLNDEPLTPAKQKTAQGLMPGMQQLMASTARSAKSDVNLGFEHQEAGRIAIAPYRALESMDAPLYSVALRFADGVDGEKLVQRFLSRTGFRFFVGLPDASGRLRALAYTSLGVTSMEGLGALAIPMAIAALIVLNTMMGAVYERFREIGVYSSVGLAPVHIAFLFIAESCVYGVLGVTMGYLIGQAMARLLIALDLLGGISLNYSSTAAVSSALLVMLVVLLSSLYPARMASRQAVPDVVRRWQLPEPDGDVWRFFFPFTVNRNAIESLCGYLYSYFSAYSHESVGQLYTERTRIVVDARGGEQPRYAVQLLVWLAPFDMGVSEYLQLTIAPTEVPGISGIELYLERISGPVAFWRRLNLGFMLALRQQFLVWQTLKDQLHRDHAQTTRRVAIDAAPLD